MFQMILMTKVKLNFLTLKGWKKLKIMILNKLNARVWTVLKLSKNQTRKNSRQHMLIKTNTWKVLALNRKYLHIMSKIVDFGFQIQIGLFKSYITLFHNLMAKTYMITKTKPIRKRSTIKSILSKKAHIWSFNKSGMDNFTKWETSYSLGNLVVSIWCNLMKTAQCLLFQEYHL